MNTESIKQRHTAFLFPGQGSQSVGMLKAFSSLPQYASIMEEASDALGFDLKKLIADGPDTELNLTINTQPALVAASYLIYVCYRDWGGELPEIFAGHSLGEYSALVCSEALSFETAIRLVRFRAHVMQGAVPVGEGGMAAVLGLSDELVIKACREASELGIVEAVNFNMPGQVVIAGSTAAVSKASEICKTLGAKRVVALRVSGPFHSSLLSSATVKLREYLDTIEIFPPKVPVIHNVGIRTIDTPELIKAALAKQVSSPVDWVRTLDALKAQGINFYCECGPGSVLSTIATRSIPGADVRPMNSPEAIKRVIEEIKE